MENFLKKKGIGLRVLSCEKKKEAIKSVIFLMLIALICSPLKIRAQSDDKSKEYIYGTVVDTSDEPLIGVRITLKGLMTGSITDLNGKFKLEIPNDYPPKQAGYIAYTIEVNYIGMGAQVLDVAPNANIRVVMKEQAHLMQEVVVTGYQKISKQSMVGSTASIKAEELTIAGSTTLEQALQGKLPGMMVINKSGMLGTRQKIRIRGQATLLGSTEPVWVVDGMIQNDPVPFDASRLVNMGDNAGMINEYVGSAISWLNPNDIESITVLKDASSTSIYGVKAANGVIVITTKKGKEGSLNISYHGDFSFTPRLNYRKANVMNSKERVGVSREAYEKGYTKQAIDNFGYSALAMAYLRKEISLDEFTNQAHALETRNTDWFKELYHSPLSHRHSIGISGGSSGTTYRASMGINLLENNAKGNTQDQYTASISLQSRFKDILTFGFSLAGSRSKTNGYAGIDPYSYAMNTSRTVPVRDDNGQLWYYPQGGFNYNILNELSNSGNRNVMNNTNAQFNLKWRIFDFVDYEFGLSYQTGNTSGRVWYTDKTNLITRYRGYELGGAIAGDELFEKSQLSYGGELDVSEAKNHSYMVRNQLNFIKGIDNHTVTVSLGQEISSKKSESFNETKYGYLKDKGGVFAYLQSQIVDYYNYDSDGNKTPVYKENPLLKRTLPTVLESRSNMLSFYGIANYMFDNRYVVTGTIRMDASNRFGQDKRTRFQPVWSAGIKWNMTNEKWMQEQDLVNGFDLRFTYGYQGNIAETVSPDLIAKYMPPTTTKGDYTLVIQSLPAPDLNWEKTRTYNFGVDFALFSHKINGSFEYYYKKTTDLIVSRPVPMEMGVATRMLNGGDMTNKGWDLSLSFVPVRTKDWIWSVGMSVSGNSNSIKSTLNPTGSWKEAASGNYFKDGHAANSFWAWKFAGINDVNGGPIIDMSNITKKGADIDPTIYMEYAGRTEPSFTSGFNTVLTYKKITLAANFYLSTGNKAFLQSPYRNMTGTRLPNEYDNMSSEWVNRWRKTGDVTTIPALPESTHNNRLEDQIIGGNPKVSIKYSPYQLYEYSTVRVVDAWYLRCQNLSVTYPFPKSILRNFNCKYLSLALVVSNPFQIVSKDFKGRDPEVARGSQPLSRTYSMKVNVNF